MVYFTAYTIDKAMILVAPKEEDVDKYRNIYFVQGPIEERNLISFLFEKAASNTLEAYEAQKFEIKIIKNN